MPDPVPDSPLPPEPGDRLNAQEPAEKPDAGGPGIVSRLSLLIVALVLAMALGLIWRMMRTETVEAAIYRLGPVVGGAAEQFQGFSVNAKRTLNGESAARVRKLLDSPDAYDNRAGECPQYTLGFHTVRGGRTLDAVVCPACGMA